MKSAVKLEVAVSGGTSKPNIPNKANKKITSRVENNIDIKINEDYKKKIDGIFSSKITPKNLLNEYRRNMILLDIQTEVLCEIPKKKDSLDILEVESVKNTFLTMSEAIMIALQADTNEKLIDALDSITSMAKSIINLFSNKISNRYLENMESYIQALVSKITEENWTLNLDSK